MSDPVTALFDALMLQNKASGLVPQVIQVLDAARAHYADLQQRLNRLQGKVVVWHRAVERAEEAERRLEELETRYQVEGAEAQITIKELERRLAKLESAAQAFIKEHTRGWYENSQTLEALRAALAGKETKE